MIKSVFENELSHQLKMNKVKHHDQG